MRPNRLSSRSALSGFMARRRALRLAAALPWAMLVVGCGQKGPLYLPPESDEEEDKDEADKDEADQSSAAPPVSDSRSA